MMFPVEIFQNTLATFIVIVRQLGIRFHLTGGLTGTAYGEPRMTQDIDIVIDPVQTKERCGELVLSLRQSSFLFNEDSLRRAVESGGMFQLLDQDECLKLDIYPRELIAGELDRSEQLEIFEGEILPVVSRVDAAASKLVWISKGSHKSRRDLRAIYQQAAADQQIAIRAWAEKANYARLLDEVLAESNELE